MMDWLIFGDDFGAHPSTTQHLARALPSADRIVWVDSLGMRAPRVTLADARRIVTRLWPRLPRPSRAPGPPQRPGLEVVHPWIVPWHGNRIAQQLNGGTLGLAIGRAARRNQSRPTVALLSNPVGVLYLDALPRSCQPDRVVYLRLDDYVTLPGVDAALVAPIEAALIARADEVVVTAERLAPPGARSVRYLPQGVDVAHFASIPDAPPESHVLGFFGLLAEWIDWPLVAEVAARCPSWTLELLGPVRALPDTIAHLPNVRVRAGVPYATLPQAIAHWRAAWIPFEVTERTAGVNPLKLREYLAAGFPTASTALPEACRVAGISIVASASDVADWLEAARADTPDARHARRALVRSEGWDRRAATLRAWAGGTP